MSRILLKLNKVSIDWPPDKLPQDGQRIIKILDEVTCEKDKNFILEYELKPLESEVNSKAQSLIEPWVKDMNAQYQKVMSSIITLATSALILPIIFIRDFLNIPLDESVFSGILEIGITACMFVVISWLSWLFSIVFAILYFYFSAFRLKNAWISMGDAQSEPNKLIANKKIQNCLTLTFRISVISFGVGVISFFMYAVVAYIN